MSNQYIIIGGELYHYGVKGMKWGVRKSEEVQSVNRAYKQELKGLKKDLNAQKRKNFRTGWGQNFVYGGTYGTANMMAKNHKANKDFKAKKKELQEKYEPDFKKAQSTAEKRLDAEKITKKAAAKAEKQTTKIDADTRISELESMIKTDRIGRKVDHTIKTIGGLTVAGVVAMGLAPAIAGGGIVWSLIQGLSGN